MKMPDVTQSQAAALLQSFTAVVIAFTADITEEQSIALLGLSAVIGGILMHSDAKIRKARNKRIATQRRASSNRRASGQNTTQNDE